MKRTTKHLLRIFITGLLAALPLAATVAVFAFAANILVQWLGPDSAVGRVMIAIGLGVTGSEIVGYLIGVGLVALGIFLLGLLVETGLQRGVARIVSAVVSRIPVVRTVYDLAHKMVGLFSQRDQDGMKSMSAVWCHFGGPGGAAVLALLSTPTPIRIGGVSYLAVLVPTAPVPVGGGLLYVPEHWVTPAQVGVEALTSIYVSMGVTSLQHLPPGRAGAAAAPASAPAQPAPVSSSDA
ncbi:MAG: DUF502 domain-containing protein [Rubrivivax sp.]|jgi:uncharacterized membrane protein|nr:DUF502 domain-containing protein [Rubrivivax sp.]